MLHFIILKHNSDILKLQLKSKKKVLGVLNGDFLVVLLEDAKAF